MQNQARKDTVDFGYEEIPREEKVSRVRDIFARVAGSYDLMNDLMSGGLHRWWKYEFLNQLSPSPIMHLLDLAGGTGDIAFSFLKRGGAKVTIADINEAMLEEGRKRAIDSNLLTPEFVCANAESLPFEANSFEACTIAFGIRNVTDIPKALNEIHRVLKPGGHFLCLEFSQVKSDLLRPLYDFYSFNIIPRIGEAVAGDRASYQYLVESIRRFPNQENFKSMIESAGFKHVSYRNLSGGIVAIHSGWKI